jgi:drug/metabolite transporter (DMT)-like permease
VWLAADLVTWQISLHMTSVANSTLLVNMAPIFVTLGGWLLLRQSVSRAFLIGLAISIAGGVVLEGGPGAFGRGHLRGDAVAIGAAVFYAGYILLLGHARQRFSTTSIMLWSTVSAALITLPLAIVLEPTLTPATLSGWAVVVGLAWISHTGGQGLIAFSLAWLPVTMSSLTLLIQPVVAAVLAWAVLGEHLGAFQMIGGCIVIAGIVLARHG